MLDTSPPPPVISLIEAVIPDQGFIAPLNLNKGLINLINLANCGLIHAKRNRSIRVGLIFNQIFFSNAFQCFTTFGAVGQAN